MPERKKDLISIIVPCYNEQAAIPFFYKEIDRVSQEMKEETDFELLFVDDGSKDETAARLIEAFSMRRVERPVHLRLKCRPLKAVYEAPGTKVKLTLVRKENGGKGDSLNMGINVSRYPYFLSLIHI